MRPPLIFYHGTTSPTAFEAFRPKPNPDCPTSGLGIYVSEDPLLAAEYGETRKDGTTTGRILSVLFTPRKTGIISSSDAFFGTDPDRDPPNRTKFVEARHKLIQQGFDSLYLEDFADNISRTWIMLCPARATILHSHPLSEAHKLPDTDTSDIFCEYSSIASLI